MYTLYIIKNSQNEWGVSLSTTMFSFGEFASVSEGQSNFKVWELLLFVLVKSAKRPHG